MKGCVWLKSVCVSGQLKTEQDTVFIINILFSPNQLQRGDHETKKNAEQTGKKNS